MSNVHVLLALAPFILGVILGDQIEINLVRAIMSDANPTLFLTRPSRACCSPSRPPPSCSRCGSAATRAAPGPRIEPRGR